MLGGFAGRLVSGRRALMLGGRGLRVGWRLVNGRMRRRRCRAGRGRVWRRRCNWHRMRLGHRARGRHVLRDRRRVRPWGWRHGVRRHRMRRGGRCRARLERGRDWLRRTHGRCGVRRRWQVRHRRGRGRRHPGVFSRIQRDRLWRMHGLRRVHGLWRPGRLAARECCWRRTAHRLGRLRRGAALGRAVLARARGLLRTVCLPCAVPVVLPGCHRRRRRRR
jgi:hypothetical protein